MKDPALEQLITEYRRRLDKNLRRSMMQLPARGGDRPELQPLPWRPGDYRPPQGQVLILDKDGNQLPGPTLEFIPAPTPVVPPAIRALAKDTGVSDEFWADPGEIRPIPEQMPGGEPVTGNLIPGEGPEQPLPEKLEAPEPQPVPTALKAPEPVAGDMPATISGRDPAFWNDEGALSDTALFYGVHTEGFDVPHTASEKAKAAVARLGDLDAWIKRNG